jgi:hypothetical protein
VPEEVDLLDILDVHKEQILDSIYTWRPGKVIAFDSSTSRARVQPMVPRVRFDAQGNKTIEQLPEISDVPVIYQRSGDVAIVFPLKQGDGVILLSSDVAIGTWRETGQATDPGDVRRHSLSHVVAIPGVFPDADASDQLVANALVLSAPTVVLGDKLASDYVALASKVTAALTTMVATFNAHTHTVPTATPLPPATAIPPTTPPTTPMSAPASVAATKVKGI